MMNPFESFLADSVSRMSGFENLVDRIKTNRRHAPRKMRDVRIDR